MYDSIIYDVLRVKKIVYWYIGKRMQFYSLTRASVPYTFVLL